MAASPLPLRRRLCTALMGAALLGLAGCSQLPRQLPGDTAQALAGHWSGRMALQVQDTQSYGADQNQSFSAAFELQGTPHNGELLLLTPLGSVLARLSWTPDQASLEQGGNSKSSDSLQSLVLELTGTELPIPALFDWLHGQPTSVPGWETDLSRMEQGRLLAQRLDPAPSATLRIVLDQAQK
nr:outer membrane lipoprotein LolB [Comamonas composti]